MFDVRLAADTDLDGVAQVWHASASLPGVAPPVIPTLEQLRHRVDEELVSGWKLFVAVCDEVVIGMLALNLSASEVAQIFVHPSHIGKRVGKALLQQAKLSMPNGFSLFTASTNQRAQQFYGREGLVFLRESQNPRTGHLVKYYKWIGQPSL